MSLYLKEFNITMGQISCSGSVEIFYSLPRNLQK